MADWLPLRRVSRARRHLTRFEFYLFYAPRILADKTAEVYVWGFAAPDAIRLFCERRDIPFQRVEDGFLRSVALGAQRVPPLSLCFDSRTLYYDATRPSSLELFLQEHDFGSTPDLVSRAEAGIERLIGTRLSKYNVGASADVREIYGPKTARRVLVVGQVEGDMSIRLGCDRAITNNDLVRLAVAENPGAQVIYKPHPEVLRDIRKKPRQSKPDEVRDIALVLDQDIALADAFETIDHVYTITSLSGFEALIRGIPVTCLGMPFYAGWGVTDDRQNCPRRTRRRSVTEIFAAAYIHYARYLDPVTKTAITFEEALDVLERMRREATPS